ncbi:MAG: hypothetical protein ACI4QZ_06240 [Eubacteriales bacterium]
MASIRKPKEKIYAGFRKALLIYTSALLAVILISLGVLALFLDTYEKNLPEKTAIKYTESLAADDFSLLRSMAAQIVTENDEKIESVDSILSHFGFFDGEMQVTKLAKEYTHDAPVYRIVCNDTPVGKITLKKAEKKALFGLGKWEIDSAELELELLCGAERGTYTVCVPAGSALKINGNTAGEEYLALSGEKYSGKAVTPAETLCDIYKFELYVRPELEIVSNEGGALALTVNKKSADYFTENANSFTLVAPYEATVLIDGVSPDLRLAEKAELTEELSEFEQVEGLELPAMCSYTVYGSEEKNVSASVRGEELDCIRESGKLTFLYTEKSKYTVRVTVPKGAEVCLNGVPVSDAYLSGTSEYKTLSEDIGVSDAFGEGDVFEISGLLAVPEISAELDGKALPVTYVSRSAHEICEEFVGLPSDALKKENTAFAERFAKAYIHYVANGAVGLEENSSALLALMKSGSTAQKKIIRSKESFAFVNQGVYTIEKLEARDFIQLEGGAFVCKVDFSVTIRFYRAETPYVGTLSLVCCTDGASALVSGLSIDASGGADID